jgi:hypothetical protein
MKKEKATVLSKEEKLKIEETLRNALKNTQKYHLLISTVLS